MSENIKQFTKLDRIQKFTYLLDKKINKENVEQEMDSLTVEELKQLKIWVAETKQEAEFKIWKKKRDDRAAQALKE